MSAVPTATPFRVAAVTIPDGPAVAGTSSPPNQVSSPPSRAGHTLHARPLRGLERTLVALGGAHCTDLIIGEVLGSLYPDALQTAVHALVRRHPILRGHLSLKRGEPLVVLAAGPPMLPVEIRAGEWTRHAERLLRTPLGGDVSPWRLVAVPGGDSFHLLLAAHHALVDGRTMSRLLADLLHALLDPNHLGPPLPVMPSALDLDPGHLAWRSAAPLLSWAWAWRIRRSHARTPFPAPRLEGDQPPTTLLDTTTLPGGVIDHLHKAAHAHGTTVGGAFVAATWEATRDLAGADDAWIPVEAMVDLRRMDQSGLIGLHTGGVQALPGLRVPIDRWQRATWATTAVRHQVHAGAAIAAHLVGDRLANPTAWLRRRGVDLGLQGGAGAVVHVSNVGRWPHPTATGNHRLSAAFSASSAIRSGPALLVWLRTVGRRGCLSAIGNGSAVSRAQLQTWLASIARILQEMARR